MSKTIAIVQSNYIPWKGYFDLINMVDEFVLYDDMQYTKRDWRNRNKIKTINGLAWLTIPVDNKGKYLQKINETVVSDHSWAETHFRSIVHNYAKARYFSIYKNELQNLYTEAGKLEKLSDINYLFIQSICNLLGIRTKISWSMDYHPLIEGKNEKLIGICKAANANYYISGPAAQSYMEEKQFLNENITVSYIDYLDYPTYDQLFGEFEHGVTIWDLILNEGPNAKHFMRSF